LAVLFLWSTACNPDSGNAPSPGAKGPSATPMENPGEGPNPQNPTQTPEESLRLAGCSNANLPASDHQLQVTMDQDSNVPIVDFAKESERSLRVISLYVTGMKDEVPIFPRFAFSGTALWMVSLTDPFETYFQLPVRYRKLPDGALDVTERYKGSPDGTDLQTIDSPICAKVTVITFEADEEQPFKTSAFLLPLVPQKKAFESL